MLSVLPKGSIADFYVYVFMLSLFGVGATGPGLGGFRRLSVGWVMRKFSWFKASGPLALGSEPPNPSQSWFRGSEFRVQGLGFRVGSRTIAEFAWAQEFR